MDIYRNGPEAFATLSLSNHDVKELIKAFNLDANVYAIKDKYFIDATSHPEFMILRRNELMYLSRRFYRIPFYREVYVSNIRSDAYFVITRCVGIDKWSSHVLFFESSLDLIRGYESVFHKI